MYSVDLFTYLYFIVVKKFTNCHNIKFVINSVCQALRMKQQNFNHNKIRDIDNI